MKNKFIWMLMITLAVYGCQQGGRSDDASADVNADQSSPEKLLELLVGDWQLESTGSSRGDSAQRMTFTAEARYFLRQGNTTVDSGSYRMNEQLRNLYLESDVNENPREFELDLQENMLTLTPKQASNGSAQRLVYRRVSP